MKTIICKFCECSDKSEYFDMKVCQQTCGDKTCKLGFDCKIASGVDICPECGGLGQKIETEQ